MKEQGYPLLRKVMRHEEIREDGRVCAFVAK